MMRQKWFEILYKDYSASPNTILQILFDIHDKLFCMNDSTQNLMPELTRLCEEFHAYVDIRQQQDLADFYIIIVGQIHQIVNNNTEKLHQIDKNTSILAKETIDQFFTRLTTKLWNITDNSLLTQYQNFWTIQLMTCQHCAMLKCTNCPCKRHICELAPNWLITCKVSGQEPGVKVAMISVNGKPIKNFHFAITKWDLITNNQWADFIELILHKEHKFDDIKIHNNEVTISNTILDIKHTFIVYTTDCVYDNHKPDRLVSHIHSSRNVNTFPPLSHFFETTNCICLQECLNIDSYRIAVAVSQAPSKSCTSLTRVLAMPFFYQTSSKSNINTHIWQTNYLSLVTPQNSIIYCLCKPNPADWNNLMSCNMIWDHGKNLLDDETAKLLTADAELLVVTSDSAPPFYVCIYMFVHFANNALTCILWCSGALVPLLSL